MKTLSGDGTGDVLPGPGKDRIAVTNASKPMEFRFDVALSFAGDGKRDRVRSVAELLQRELGKGRVFFDEWFEVELAGHDGNNRLQDIYRKKARLVVACICGSYADKPWTQEEWRAIQAFERGLRRGDGGPSDTDRMRFLPLRFGDGEVDGLFETAFVPDVRHRTAEQIAELILDRLQLAKGSGNRSRKPTKKVDTQSSSPTSPYEVGEPIRSGAVTALPLKHQSRIEAAGATVTPSDVWADESEFRHQRQETASFGRLSMNERTNPDAPEPDVPAPPEAAAEADRTKPADEEQPAAEGVPQGPLPILLQPARVKLFGLEISGPVALVGVVLVLAAVLLLWRTSKGHPEGAPGARPPVGPSASSQVPPKQPEVAKPAPPPELPHSLGMVAFAGGMLSLGDIDAAAAPSECRVHRGPTCRSRQAEATRIAAFEIDAHETTADEFAAWLRNNPDVWSRSSSENNVLVLRKDPRHPIAWAGAKCAGIALAGSTVRVKAGAENRPLTCVSWYGAHEYCAANHKRLPTEAEWEWVAKGIQRRPFPWGKETPREDVVAFHREESLDVGSANWDVTPEGVYDLAGNVAEWSGDSQGPTLKVVRGGSWASADPCNLLTSQCAARRADDYTTVNIGFRCVRSLGVAEVQR
jgi:formylglycine-generating enzyme required for sulfatase activity